MFSLRNCSSPTTTDQPQRFPLALSIATMLALGTAFGIGNDPTAQAASPAHDALINQSVTASGSTGESASGPDALPAAATNSAAAAPSAPALAERETSLDREPRLSPASLNGSERPYGTGRNQTIDYGDGD